MRKRCMSILLAFCMVWTLFPASTLAETSDGDAVPIIADAVPIIAEADATSPDETSEESAALSDAGDAMTRGAWMRELVNLFGLTLKKEEYPDIYFPDIEESAYFDDIMIATKYGFVNVEAGDNFEPDKPLTREFAAWTLNFKLGFVNERTSYTFSDSAETEYPDDAQAAIDQGWFALQGGNFLPDATVTAVEVETMRKSAAEITAARTIGAPNSHYKFADYVKELPEGTVQDSEIDFENNITTLTISGYAGSLARGDNFAYYYQGLAFVYETVSVSENDGVLTVTAKEARDGAILEYDFSGEITPQVTAVELNQEPVTLTDASGETFTFQQAELQAIEGTHDFDDIKIKWNVLSGSGVSGTLSGAIKNIRLEVYKATLFEVRFRLKGDINITSTLSMDFTKNSSAKSITLGKAELFGFGEVDIVLNLQMRVEVGFVFDGSFTLGPDYKLGQTVYWEKDATLKESTYVSVNGHAEVLLKVHAQIGITNIAAMDGQLTVGPKADGYAKEYEGGSPRVCVNAEGYLYGNVNLTATLLGKSHPLYDKTFLDKNSPARFSAHFEDGKRVSACTCPNREGKADSGYSTPKYSTPVNSRFYADNSRNANSTWSGGASAEPVVIWTTADNNDGTVTVTGYSGNASILNIPETIDGKTVTIIGNKAFQNKTTIRIVNMPDTVTSVGSRAFAGCANLATVQFSANLTEIDEYAFQNTALTTAELPEGLLYLGRTANGNGSSRVFYNCKHLESVYIPSTLTACGNDAYNNNFGECTKLDSVIFGEGITAIPAYLFTTCPGLTHIEIPDTVTSIYRSAFNSCTNLSSVAFSKNLTEIGSYAFQNTALTTAERSRAYGFLTICRTLESIILTPAYTSRFIPIRFPVILFPWINFRKYNVIP